MDNQEEAESVQKVATVSAMVLTTFFEELSKTEELADVAINLRRLVLEEGQLSEPVIRAVLFPDAP